MTNFDGYNQLRLLNNLYKAFMEYLRGRIEGTRRNLWLIFPTFIQYPL